MKRLFLVSHLLFFLFTSHAQSTQFGLKAGLNISNINSNYTGNLDPRTGLNAGAIANITLQRSWAIQPEIYYSSQGAKYYSYDDGYNHQLVLNYVNIPFLIQYKLRGGVFLETGPQAGF